MNKLQQNLLKKSRSHYTKKQVTQFINPQDQTPKKNMKSHLEELILQKYNFHNRLKTSTNQSLIKRRPINTTLSVPSSNMILLSQLPKIQHSQSINSQISLISKESKRRQNDDFPLQNYAINLVNCQKRKLSEYKDCMKRIQMNTTYRGFNLSKQKFYKNNQDNRCVHAGNLSEKKLEDESKTTLKAAERKKIVSYIIEKGFARRKQEQLMKIKSQKRKTHQQVVLEKHLKVISPLKIRRSVVFSNAAPTCSESKLLSHKTDVKDHQIQPW